MVAFPKAYAQRVSTVGVTRMLDWITLFEHFNIQMRAHNFLYDPIEFNAYIEYNVVTTYFFEAK